MVERKSDADRLRYMAKCIEDGAVTHRAAKHFAELMREIADRREADLRDGFARSALEGILAGGFADTVPHDDVGGGSDAATFAYQYADAMLATRKKWAG
ncbi:MAG: hypothetical protein AAFQ73_07925 [Pseudomonadota bacterium]